MEANKVEMLVTNGQIGDIVHSIEDTGWDDFVSVGEQVRAIYEEARTKDQETIRALRDALEKANDLLVVVREILPYAITNKTPKWDGQVRNTIKHNLAQIEANDQILTRLTK